MNLSVLLNSLLLLFVLPSSSNGLRILFVLPCYGGHFGTMIPLIVSTSENHNVTVLQTSPSCQKKLAPFQSRSSFSVLEEDLTFKDMHFNNFFDGVWIILKELGETNRKLLSYLKGFWTKYRQDFDLMIVDASQVGSALSAEVANIPVAVVLSGYPGGVENVIEKLEFSLIEVMFIKLMFYNYQQSFLQLREENNLPELESDGSYYVYEYMSRFPSLVATSPNFYPDLHPSIPYRFIGGPRKAEDYGPISDNLLNWLSQEETGVVYLSLGTHFTLSENQILDYVGKVRTQGNYRLIWSLGKEMQKLVGNLNLLTDKKLFFSDYLPQYTLLGHDKVTVFVTHGGLGSSIDLIKRRKPSVCAPQIFDQFFNCKKLQSLSIAETVSSFNFGTINDAIKKVLDNYKDYVTNADRIAKDFESYENQEDIDSFLAKVASKGEVDVIRKFQFKFCSEKCSQAWFVTKVSLGALAVTVLVLLVLICRWCIRRCFRRSTKEKKN